jgi:ATP-dependent helicase/nuclease subunit A
MSATLPDASARRDAIDPVRNVVLEASAGTGKTRVLVERYVNLLRAGVEPDHILAITFTRKAAAEMRERIIDRLREASRDSLIDLALWRDLKDRLGDIAISTIDAFCLSLLREFPLEADVDPAFELADDTEVPRLVEESLDLSLRICRAVAADDDDVALVFAQLGERRLRAGLAGLLNQRLVAPRALHRYLASSPRDLTAASACRHAAERLRDALVHVPRGTDAFLTDGPIRQTAFAMFAADIRRSREWPEVLNLDTRSGQAAFRAIVDRLRTYFLTQDGRPREKAFAGTGYKASDCDSEAAWKRHRQAAASIAPAVAEAIRGFRRDLNAVQARGVWRIFSVTLRQYQRTLESHVLLDFSGVLDRAIGLLKDMDEFAESRFRLEARYRHVLVDEFQDTSRAQWELVAQLVRSWGEGSGAAADALLPSLFIVGDRKQSIYGFRDAEVAVLDEAGVFVQHLRADGDPRRSITVSFRAVPALLALVNDVFEAVEKSPNRNDAFRYDDRDRFPVDAAAPGGSVRQRAAASVDGAPPLGLVTADSVGTVADRVADEIVRLLDGATVRDRASGVRREAQASDIAILFRSRDSHREFEKALERRAVPTYVYKGLGFFDADEIQDASALLRYLADPSSDLRAAAFLRSRLVRVSDRALMRLGPEPARAILEEGNTAAIEHLDQEDRAVLARIREQVPRWLSWVDRMSPSELLSAVLQETAYAYETRGGRRRQAHENLKKLRFMVARFQNRGYATLARVADHLEQLAAGDESNAAIDAIDAVSLMTVHAAKGLEFPIVFLVNMGRGTGNIRAPIRVSGGATGQASVSVADYQSEADEDVAAREREETKRLLYVAMTRARDRLYLSATVRDGVFRATRGSLGEVLPAALKQLLASASGSSEGTLEWTGASGTQHRFRVPPVESAALVRAATTAQVEPINDVGEIR